MEAKIDKVRLADNYILDEAGVESLLALFQKSIATDVALLEQAISDKDLEQIFKVAHKLKSSFSYLMLPEVSTIFEYMRSYILKGEDLDKIRLEFEHFFEDFYAHLFDNTSK